MKGNISMSKSGGVTEDSYIKCHRTTIEIQTPAWENQPTIQPVTMPFMVIVPTYAKGSAGPATLYVERRTDLSQVQAGDKLCWWGGDNVEPTVEDLRNTVYDTVASASVSGSTLEVTTTGGNAFSSSNISYANIKSAGSDTLLSDFKPWTDACYFVTLKNTDGTALESGKFKLCTALDGYATALNQVFYLPSLATETEILNENFPIDFLEISADRRTFTMRTAGILGKNFVSLKIKNHLLSKYNLSFVGNIIVLPTTQALYIDIHDEGMKATAGKFYNGERAYNQAVGYLFWYHRAKTINPLSNGKCPTAFSAHYTRVTNGSTIEFNMIFNNAERVAFNNGLYLVNDKNIDFTKVAIGQVHVGMNTGKDYFANGSTITLEEIG